MSQSTFITVSDVQAALNTTYDLASARSHIYMRNDIVIK